MNETTASRFGANDWRDNGFMADLEPAPDAILAGYRAYFPDLDIREGANSLVLPDGRPVFVLSFSIGAKNTLALDFTLHRSSPGFAGSELEEHILSPRRGWSAVAWAAVQAGITRRQHTGDVELPSGELWDVIASSRGESFPGRYVTVALVPFVQPS